MSARGVRWSRTACFGCGTGTGDKANARWWSARSDAKLVPTVCLRETSETAKCYQGVSPKSIGSIA
jgi:hypothetical protein